MPDVIRREMMDDLRDHLEADEISFIVGSRQVGKTTLMNMLESELDERGENTLYLSLDIEGDRNHFSSQSELLNRIELEFGEETGYVFIDEIQRKKNAGLFLKGVYDRDLPYKFVVSGSGSLELKEDVHESLAGRKRLFELPPVTFQEFVDYRTGYKYEDRLQNYFKTRESKARNLLEEYLNYGGYPRVVTARKENEKRRVIDEIFSSYLERDISNLLNVRKVDAFSKLVSVLADQMGDVVSYSKLSRDVGVKTPTIRNYIDYMDKTFTVRQVKPFFTNKRKEIVKSPVIYFSDPGLRNYSIDRFGNITTSTEKGKVFESFVYNLFRHRLQFTSYTINYWRTKSGAEIDLVLSIGNKPKLPVEVKYRELEKDKVSRSMRSFIQKYSPDEAWIINLTKKEELTLEGTEIKFIPVFELETGFRDKIP